MRRTASSRWVCTTTTRRPEWAMPMASVRFGKLLNGFPRRQFLQDELNRDARPSHHGLAHHHVRVRLDPRVLHDRLRLSTAAIAIIRYGSPHAPGGSAPSSNHRCEARSGYGRTAPYLRQHDRLLAAMPAEIRASRAARRATRLEGVLALRPPPDRSAVPLRWPRPDPGLP